MDVLGKNINLGLLPENILPGPGGPPPKEEAIAGPQHVPILEGLPEDKNGTITLLGQNTNGANLDHIFSFTYYLPEGNVFEESLYFYGLQAYIELAHGTIQVEKVSFPYSCGVIIYTDRRTVGKLLETFPLERYPNLVIALVEWPFFSNEEGNVVPTIMRTLRFHAVEHFPTKNVHMRDADTLYVAKINEIKGDTNIYHKTLFHILVYQWEAKYFATLPLIQAKGKEIVFGSFYGYVGNYHFNLPYPISFQFPIRMFQGYIYNRFQPDQYLYLRSEDLPYELDKKVNAVYQNIRQYYGKDEKNLKYSNDPKRRQQILNLWKEREKAAPWSKEQQQAQKKINTIANEIKQEIKSKIPKENFLPTPFSSHLKEFMRKGSPAVYAGFVSVLQNRKGIENFWKYCVEYLFSRYKMTDDIETGRKIISNNIFKTYAVGRKGKISLTSVLAIGKDERMLMYGVAPKVKDKIFAFPIMYSTEVKNIKGSGFYEPDLYFQSTVNPEIQIKNGNYSLTKTFLESTESHQKWLTDFYKKFPTEKDFLNAIDTMLVEKLVPVNKLNASHIVKSNNPPANPYAYPPLVKRGGRTQKRKAKRTSKTHKH